MEARDMAALRLRIAHVLLAKKDHKYHRTALHGTEKQRIEAFQECDLLRKKMDALREEMEEGGESDGQDHHAGDAC